MSPLIRPLLLVIAVLLAGAPRARAETDPVRASAFILLKQPRLPAAAEVRDRLEARLAGRLEIDGIESDDKAVVLLRIRGGTVMVGLIDAPMPEAEVREQCGHAWYWKGACEAASQHHAQAYLSVLGSDLDKLDAHLLLTDVAAVLMDDNAIASSWAGSFQSRDAFLRQSAHASRSDPPVPLWIDFRVSSDPVKGFCFSTLGLEEFGLREIEARDVNGPGREIFALLIGMAAYLIERGPVIKDGDTIGDSPSLNIRVRQGPSYWREGATVYRVTFPAP